MRSTESGSRWSEVKIKNHLNQMDIPRGDIYLDCRKLSQQA